MGKHVHLLGVFAGPMLGAFVDSADAESLQIRIGSLAYHADIYRLCLTGRVLGHFKRSKSEQMSHFFAFCSFLAISSVAFFSMTAADTVGVGRMIVTCGAWTRTVTGFTECTTTV